MSPSKRAGGTVESGVDDDQPSANGNGDANGHGADGDKARPRRRSILSPARTPAPERGSSSARGASSSSITKRSVAGFGVPALDDDPAIEAVPADMTVEQAAVEQASLDEPAATPTATSVLALAPADDAPVAETAAPPVTAPPEAPVDPATDPAPSMVPTPVPITLPASPSGPPVSTEPVVAHGSSQLTTTDVPLAPPEPPYVTTTLSSHQIAPVPRLLGRRPRVRRVTRVVRHVDPWSVFKVALMFNLVLYIVLLTAGVLLWNVAYATGTVDNLERFFESFGWSSFEFHGGAIFHAAWIAGLFGVIGLTGATVLAATLFNLITDLVGGVRLTVLEEEVQERTMAPMRRFVVRRPTSNGSDPASGLGREVDRLEPQAERPIPSADT